LTRVEVLDSATIRCHLVGGPSFTKEDRATNVRRIAFVCALLSRNGVITVVAAVSPDREARREARRMANRFVEVFVDCPLETCVRRDAATGRREDVVNELQGFAGASDTYEPPDSPEVICKTSEEPPAASVRRIIETLERLQLVPPEAAYSAEEEEQVRKRLEGLGYL